MTREQLTTLARKAIQQNRSDVALDALLAYTQADTADLHAELTLLRSRYTRNEALFSQKLQNRDDYEIELNQINHAISGIFERLPASADVQISAFEKWLQDEQKPASGRRSGKVLYSIPLTMQAGKRHRCAVRIAYETFSEALMREGMPDTAQVASIRVGQLMKVALEELPEEDFFDITPLNDEEQLLEEGEFTEWGFLVKANRPGAHILVLRISIAEIVDKFGERWKNIIALDKEIRIVSEEIPETPAPFEEAPGLRILTGPAAALPAGAIPAAPSPSPVPQPQSSSDAAPSAVFGKTQSQSTPASGPAGGGKTGQPNAVYKWLKYGGLSVVLLLIGTVLMQPLFKSDSKQPASPVDGHQTAPAVSDPIKSNASSGEIPELQALPAGSFRMGNTHGLPDERPVQTVAVKAFSMGKYEVTLAQFQAFVKASAYVTDAERQGGANVWTASGPRWKAGANWRCDPKGKVRPDSAWQRPVLFVSWNDATAYCKWLSSRTGKLFRLPTEAEWEYAARAGTTGRWAGSDDAPALQRFAWFAANSRGDVQPVGRLKPNVWGLYDLSGNAWEWCRDVYAPYGRPAAGDNKRVGRGGGWSASREEVQVSRRYAAAPDFADFGLGFRVASSAKP